MAFTVEDLQDLIRLIDAHPEWRAELRRHVLGDDLTELPATLRRLADAQEQTARSLATLTARVDALAAAQEQTAQTLATLASRVEVLAEAQVRTQQQLADLTREVASLTRALEEVAGRTQALERRLGSIAGELAEMRYGRRAHAYFARLARGIRVLDSRSLADLLDDAVARGRLTEDERTTTLLADVVFSGRRPEDQVEAFFVVEVSVHIDEHDVERAVERALLLEKLGQPAVAIVAGESIDSRAAMLAQERRVWQVLDGAAKAPVIW